MIEVGGTFLLAEVKDILYRLRRETGFLKDINLAGRKALITCPSHKGGQENKPSCLINLYDNSDYKAGDSYCFTCHTFHSLPKLVGTCFNIDEVSGAKWLIENFAGGEIENRSNLFSVPSRVKPIETTHKENLEDFKYIHPYMYKRHLTDEIIKRYNIGYDKNTDSITFPIRDEKGDLLFVVRRNVKHKHFHIPDDVEKPLCYLYETRKSHPDTRDLYVVESLFNALTLARWCKPVVALLGTGTSHQLEELKKLPYRKIIIALDNDAAGDVGAKKIKYALRDRLIERLVLKDKSKDINDYGGESWLTFQDYLEKPLC